MQQDSPDYRAVAWGGVTPVFCPQKWKHVHLKVENKNSSPRALKQLCLCSWGETFSGFKIQRPVKCILQTQNHLLFKYNELPKIFVSPRIVSKGLLWPWINSGILLTTGLSSKPVLTSGKHSINVNKGCLLRREVLVGSNLSSNLKQKIKYDPYI